MSHGCERISLHREERVKSYLSTLEKLIARLSGDELLETLKEDSISQGFIALRIQEIVETSLLVEKEAIIDKLLQENQDFKLKLEEKNGANKENFNFRGNKENSIKSNKENTESSHNSLTLDKIKKIKLRYKQKYQKALEEQTEKLFTISKEFESLQFELESKNHEFEDFKTQNEIQMEKNIKEIDSLRLEIQRKNEKLEGFKLLKLRHEKSIKEMENLRTKAEKGEEMNNLKSKMTSEKSMLQKKLELAERFNAALRNQLIKVMNQVQELRKSKDFLLNLQRNITQNLSFFFGDFQKELIRKVTQFSSSSQRNCKSSVILTKENERFISELQRLRSEKTVLEARNLSMKRGFEEEMAALKQESIEKTRVVESLKMGHIEEIGKIKCEFLKETSQLHNSLVSLQKTNETLAMKYDEEMAFFQTNYLNDLKNLKLEYRNKLESLLNNTKSSTNNTTNSGELEEIQENLKNLLRIAEKQQLEKRRRSSFREKSFDSCVREKN